jgi:acyl carrier protein
VETAVAAVWAEVLKVERVGRQDNFFQLGGHSLLAMQLISRIRATLDVELQLKDIFASSTVREMGERVRGQRALNEITSEEGSSTSFEDRYL